jgi:hypothetical protein
MESAMNRYPRDDVTAALAKNEIKVGWEMREGRRLCAVVGWSPGEVIWFEVMGTP